MDRCSCHELFPDGKAEHSDDERRQRVERCEGGQCKNLFQASPQVPAFQIPVEMGTVDTPFAHLENFRMTYFPTLSF